MKIRTVCAGLILCTSLTVLLSVALGHGKTFSERRLELPAKQAEQQLFQINRRKGWSVPGLTPSLVPTEVRQIYIDGAEVYRKKLNVPTESFTDIEFYYIDDNGQIIINSLPFVVYRLYSYEASGKTFAFEAQLVSTYIDEGGKRRNTGAMVSLFYNDNDGDGIYETRYGNLDLPKIPEQLKTNRLSMKQSR